MTIPIRRDNVVEAIAIHIGYRNRHRSTPRGVIRFGIKTAATFACQH
jgi:hypothetical protein